jgi:5-methylcytosine-specific restriction protein A
MPYAPFNSVCSELGCKQPRSKLNSFCADHGGLDHTNHGKDNAYSDPAWRTIRRGQLSKQPLCQSCLTNGHINSAVHVDHVFPWRHIGEHAFLNNVFQSLCHECHSYKTGQERKGTFIHYRSDGEKELTKADYAYAMAQVNAGENF